MGALLKARRKGAVYLTTLHSDYKKDYAHSPLKQLIFGGINARALRHMDGYVAVSEENARSLLLGSRLATIFDDRDKAASLGLQLKRLYPGTPEYQQYVLEHR